MSAAVKGIIVNCSKCGGKISLTKAVSKANGEKVVCPYCKAVIGKLNGN